MATQGSNVGAGGMKTGKLADQVANKMRNEILREMRAGLKSQDERIKQVNRPVVQNINVTTERPTEEYREPVDYDRAINEDMLNRIEKKLDDVLAAIKSVNPASLFNIEVP